MNFKSRASFIHHGSKSLKKKKEKENLLWTTKEASSAGYGQISKQCLWFLVFLARWHRPQRSELHSVLRPFNSLAAEQEKEQKRRGKNRPYDGGMIFFTAVLMKSLNLTSTEPPPLAINKHTDQLINKKLTWSVISYSLSHFINVLVFLPQSAKENVSDFMSCCLYYH